MYFLKITNRKAERVVAIIWMIFGAGLFTTMIGTLSQLLSAVDTKHTVLTKKIAVIAEFARQCKLPKALIQKMQKALLYNSENEGFLALSKHEIFEETRPDLKWKVIMEMHNKVVSQIPFFSSSPKSLVAQIVPNLQPFMAPSESILYYWGDVPYESIFSEFRFIKIYSLFYSERKNRFTN